MRRVVLGVVAVCWVAAGAPLAGAADEHQYVGAGKCRSCHKKALIGNQYGSWLEGPHHRAHETLGSERSRAIAEQLGLGAPQQEDACLRCHVTGHGIPATRFARLLEPADGVQCESCHGPGRDYRKKKIMSDPEVARSKGLWEAGENVAICVSCHNADSPTFDPVRYTLPDGSTAGFDFSLAKQRVPHAIPEDVKGRYLELEEAAKARGEKLE